MPLFPRAAAHSGLLQISPLYPALAGPVLLMALERDNGAARFQMAISKRTQRGGGAGGGLADVATRFRGQVLWADAPNKALAAVAYCFDTLYDSVFRIESA